jgi:leucyl aminopeptidase (aminopeptidase T)
MLLTEIKHEPISLPPAFDDGMGQLAEDAANFLGYDVLRGSLETPPELPRLAQALAELGIDVLNKQDVLTYMRERLVDRTLELYDEWQKGDLKAINLWGHAEENRRLAAEAESLKQRDQLWNRAFGTTQLTHAIARLESAESKVARLEAENQQLREQGARLRGALEVAARHIEGNQIEHAVINYPDRPEKTLGKFLRDVLRANSTGAT